MRLCAVLLGFGLICHAQSKIREASPAEYDGVAKAIDTLVSAANKRDVNLAKAVTTERFSAMGGTWAFVATGIPGWANRNEDLTGVQVAAMVRGVSLLTPEVAVAEGFFRSRGLKTELAGDFSSTLLLRDGQWKVAMVRAEPARLDPPFYYPIQIRHTHAGKEWIPLIGNGSLTEFCSMDGSTIPESWAMDGDALKLTPPSTPRPQGGPRGTRTRETFSSFELEFDWKLGAKGNSGLKYGLYYLTGGDAAGFEYQLADDHGDGGAIVDPRQRSGGLYLHYAPAKDVVKPLGEYNHTRIVVNGRHAEHWLNGEKVVEYELSFDPLDSPLVLQNHGREIWFRNMRVRRL